MKIIVKFTEEEFETFIAFKKKYKKPIKHNKSSCDDISCFGFPWKIEKILRNNNLNTVGDLEHIDFDNLVKYHGVGPLTIKHVKYALYGFEYSN